MEYDGNLISELGFKKYHSGTKNQPFADITLIGAEKVLNNKCIECNFQYLNIDVALGESLVGKIKKMFLSIS